MTVLFIRFSSHSFYDKGRNFMNIEGTYTLQGSLDAVWTLLTHLPIIEHALPGVEQLTLIAPDTYALALHIQQAPLQGIYQGKVKITERQYPTSLSFVIESIGEKDTLSGIGTLSLQKQEEHTVIAYRGTLHVGKRTGRLTPTVMKGAAKLLIQQSFARLSEQLRAERNGHEPAKTSGPTRKSLLLAIPHLTTTSKTEEHKTLWQTVAHQLHLGADDPIQEKIWGQRVQKASSAAGLLLLIWVGTRLPRKRQAKKKQQKDKTQNDSL
jgi:carbon monoxide dehydrogenase subunit G